VSAHEACDHESTKAARAACRRDRQGEGVSSPSGGASKRSQTSSGRTQSASSPAAHNERVKREGKVDGPGPDSDICPHPHDMCYRGICTQCEEIVGERPLPARPRKVPTTTIKRYTEIIAKAMVNPRKPHEFIQRRDQNDRRCALCGKGKSVRLHSDGPADLAARFRF
jgi:hypothetical protein